MATTDPVNPDLQNSDRPDPVAEVAADEPPKTAPEPAQPATVEQEDVRASTAAQIVIALVAAGAALYFAKMVFIVLMVSILLAFILAPIADALTLIRVPRAAGALVSVLIFAFSIYLLANVSYNKAGDFIQQFPKYSGEIRALTFKLRSRAESLQQTTQKVLPSNSKEKVVKVEQQTSVMDTLANNLGTATEMIFAASFVPFLAYFMLSWQDHARTATIMLFPREDRTTAYATINAITKMVRAFIIGNFLVGLFISGISVAVFGFMHLPYFYFTGVISGFLSLVPYLGVMLALLPPIISGLGHVHSAQLIGIVVTVFGLHLIALNVLYPKFLGSRLQLNPLAVTLALLFWGWIWGAMGLILAIPMTAAAKIIFDHVPRLRAYGLWLGE